MCIYNIVINYKVIFFNFNILFLYKWHLILGALNLYNKE